MDIIRSWVTGVTAAAVIGAIVLALTPDGAVEKSVKTVVSVFLISSMILPLVKADDLNLDFEITESQMVTQNEEIVNLVGEQFKEKLRLSITETLNKNGIQVSRMSIDINTNGDEISVEKIKIILKKESAGEVSRAKEILEKEFSLQAEISAESKEV